MAVIAVSCSKSKNEGPDQPGGSGGTGGVPMLMGTPIAGTESKATIGSAGGTLKSADGKLTITIPQGAVTTAGEFSIQQVTPKEKTLELFSISKQVPAYRIKTPEVLFKELEAELLLNDPALEFQNLEQAIVTWMQDNGTGKGTPYAGKPVIDPVAKKIKSKFKKAGDLSFLSSYKIMNLNDINYNYEDNDISLVVDQSGDFAIAYLGVSEDEYKKSSQDLVVPINFAQPIKENLTVTWKLNGVSVAMANPNNGFGHFLRNRTDTMYYEAPRNLPWKDPLKNDPLQIQLSAEFMHGTSKVILLKNMTINNPNMFQLNGKTYLSADPTISVVNNVLFSIQLSDPSGKQNNIGATVVGPLATGSYVFDKQNKDKNSAAGFSVEGGKSIQCASHYKDQNGLDYYSGGSIKVSSITQYKRCKRITGEINSSLYDFNTVTNTLTTISGTATFVVFTDKQN